MWSYFFIATIKTGQVLPQQEKIVAHQTTPATRYQMLNTHSIERWHIFDNLTRMVFIRGAVVWIYSRVLFTYAKAEPFVAKFANETIDSIEY